MIVVSGAVDGVRVGRHGTRNTAAGHHAHIITRGRRAVHHVAEFANISIMTGAAPWTLRRAESSSSGAHLIVRTAQTQVGVMMIEVKRVFAVMTLGIGQMDSRTAITLWE